MYDEIALSFVWFVEVLFWIYFKHVVTHLESNWFYFWRNFFTWFLNITECFICFTIKLWESSLPLLSDFFENIWWNWKLRTSGVYNGWITSFLPWFLNCFRSISHSLSFKCPCSKPIREIFECFKAFSSSYNLCRVISAKKGIWCFTHFLGGDTETNHSIIYNSIILKTPKVMELLLSHFFVWW